MSLTYPFVHGAVVRFFAAYLSGDHGITPNGQRELISTFWFGAILLLCIGCYFDKAQDEYWRTKIGEVYWSEPLCRREVVQPSPRITLVFSTLIGVILIVAMRLAYRFPEIYPLLYRKDHGVIDLFVPASFAISALLLFFTAGKVWTSPTSTDHRTALSLGFLFLAVLFLFYVGEEVSWGQDFLQWQTPSIFSGNVENQTNLHNYFNAYFDYGYIALSLLSVVVLASVWLEYGRHWLPFNRVFFPHPSLLGLSLLISFVSICFNCVVSRTRDA